VDELDPEQFVVKREHAGDLVRVLVRESHLFFKLAAVFSSPRSALGERRSGGIHPPAAGAPPARYNLFRN
jgi:hypothetical protein